MATDPTVPIEDGVDVIFDRFLHAEAEWWPPFTPERFRGRKGFARAAGDWFDAARAWRIEVEEVVDAGDDTVLAMIRVFILGRGSGVAFEQRLFTAITVVDGRITRVNDFSERAEALEAVGLSE